MDNELISYAQSREDIILSGFFAPDERGFYVDVGANDPFADSVTKLFYDRGWHGINIEPLQQHYARLKKERPRDINLNIGVGARPSSLTLREYVAGTGLSTFSNVMKQAYAEGINEAAVEYQDHTVAVRPLRAIFKEHAVTHISFMKVDVEGFEYEVLEGNDWVRYRPEVICIEANHIERDWRPLLKQHDYHLVFFDGLNEYYVDKAKPERAKRFSFVDTVAVREPIVNYKLLPKLEAYTMLKQQVGNLEEEMALKNAYISHLERSLGEVTPLRRHFKRQLKLKLRGIDGRIMRKLGANATYTPTAPTTDPDADLLAAVRDADHVNFVAYNQRHTPTFALSMYLRVRRISIGLIGRLWRLRQV